MYCESHHGKMTTTINIIIWLLSVKMSIERFVMRVHVLQAVSSPDNAIAHCSCL